MSSWFKWFPAALVGLLTLSAAVNAVAQPVGTLRWRLQPYCNVLTLNVTQTGTSFTLDGFDDLCGAVSTPAPARGMAVPNSDGTFGIGLNIVVPDDVISPLELHASISVVNFSGTWRDSSGGAGAFAFNPQSAPGAPRPSIKPVFLSGLSAGNAAITNLATPVSSSDAATKAYVDMTVQSGVMSNWVAVYANATLRQSSPNLAGTTIMRPAGQPVGVYCVRFPPGAGVNDDATVGAVQSGFNGGVLKHIVVTTFFGHNCNAVGNWHVAVETFNSSGALTDSAFQLLIPK